MAFDHVEVLFRPCDVEFSNSIKHLMCGAYFGSNKKFAKFEVNCATHVTDFIRQTLHQVNHTTLYIECL